MTQYTLAPLKERPDLLVQTTRIINASWPRFMLNGFESNDYWNKLYIFYPEFQFVIIDPDTAQVAALGNSISLDWARPATELPERGWDWALEKGIQDYLDKRHVRTHCALAISVLPAYRNKGISSLMVKIMKTISKQHGSESLVAPLRPLMKSRYPLTPIENYLKVEDDNGLPFDPWIRVHARARGKVLKACGRSMIITATISEWEERAGMRFHESGSYVVPDALVPIEMDLDKNLGTYVEPNIWIEHLTG
jgi:GNAT superfamily N-acetyltransferase